MVQKDGKEGVGSRSFRLEEVEKDIQSKEALRERDGLFLLHAQTHGVKYIQNSQVKGRTVPFLNQP